jgi:hypothetical protein
MRSWIHVTAISAAMLFAPSVAAQDVPNYPTLPIEQHYYAEGPWTVTQATTPAGCDSKGNACYIFYPENLGADGFKHPVIAWGNGTNDTPVPPTRFATLLRHWASWGFVVIATSDGATGTGDTIIDSANYMVARNADPGSIFHDRLNVDRIGVAGHSQGATGAVNALLKSNGLIRTAFVSHIPSQIWCSSPANCVQTAQLTAATSGSIFYVSGTGDPLISPDTQLLGVLGLQSNTAYYNATPSALLKVKAILKGPQHNDIQGTPSCAGAAWPCKNGVYGYLGYPTAWMVWQLFDDADGQLAFEAHDGEIFHETDNWQSVLSNVPPVSIP